MKKIIILSALLLGVLPGRADDRSAEVLQKISAALNGYKQYEVEFSFVLKSLPDEAPPSGTGRYVVSGERYYIDLDRQEVYSDGKTKYEVNRQNREVTVDRVNPNDRTFLADPTRAFEFLDGTFTHRSEGRQTIGGRTVEVIALQAVDKSSGLSDARLYVDPATGLPVGMVYYADGSSEVNVTIKKITPLTSADPKTFVFDKNKYKDYELIDFR